MANGVLNELQEVRPVAEPVVLPTRDVRARRPPLLSGLIALQTLRRGMRVSVLVALDIAGVFLALWTALELKAVVRGKSDLALSFDQTQDFAPLACLVTVLLFARSE